MLSPSSYAGSSNTGTDGVPVPPKLAAATADEAQGKRRGTIACRRCRRLRSKCLHEQSRPPCEACVAAGPDIASECAFPRRGEKDVDRQFRRRPVPPPVPLSSAETAADAVAAAGAVRHIDGLAIGQATSPSASLTVDGQRQPSIIAEHVIIPRPLVAFDADGALPPHDEVVLGCRTFVTSYFQLGFIPKAIFIENLTRNRSTVSTFLLSCILSISARFTPALVRRYGSPAHATDHFLEISRSMASTEMYRPSLERTQAFFLLAISEWGNGDRDRSSMDMGIAVRMAALLKLHREETYQLPADASVEHFVRAESARRTFWMIQSQENLHSGYSTLAPFPLDEITAFLPCDEMDFAFGIAPIERAAQDGTPPGIANPALTISPHRCLFATLIQAHNLWGRVARRACRPEPKPTGPQSIPPWDSRSDYNSMTRSLREWEEHMPPRHRWSVWNLRGWRAEQVHLAYLAVVMVLRVSNIVARRIYLEELIAALTGRKPSVHSDAPDRFWSTMAQELFENVLELHEQIDAYFSMRSKDEGFPAILVFCVYICGSLASYLWRYPDLCPNASQQAEEMARKSLQVLSELHQAWPTSTRWQQGLQQIATPMSTLGTSNPPKQPGSTPVGILSLGETVDGHAPSSEEILAARNMLSMTRPHNSPMVGDAMRDIRSQVVAPYDPLNLAALGTVQMEEFPSELFDAELAAFLTGHSHYGLHDDWNQPLPV